MVSGQWLVVSGQWSGAEALFAEAGGCGFEACERVANHLLENFVLHYS